MPKRWATRRSEKAHGLCNKWRCGARIVAQAVLIIEFDASFKAPVYRQRMNTTLAMRVIIEGFVQGVGYRAWAVEEARTLGLRGWIRNRHDGSVEALIDGPLKQLMGFVAYCQDGPPTARVSRVATEPADHVDVPAGFELRPTD
jgi:acylphosphatase